jgi:MFS family permease
VQVPTKDGEITVREPTRVGPATLLLIGSAWFGIQFFWAFNGGSMPLFLADFVDSKFEISLVLSLAGLMGLIVPPIVGYLSDRTSQRFGRRRPYIFLGTLGIMVCVLTLPRAGGFGTIALLAGVMYAFARIAEAPYLSLVPDLTSPEQRGTASGVMNLCGSMGSIALFAASAVVWDRNPTAVFVMVALVCFGFALVTLAFVREPEVSPDAPREPMTLLAHLASLREGSSAVRWIIAQWFWWVGFMMVVSFAILFAVEELQVSEGRAFLVLLVFPIVATLLMVPMGILGDRRERKRMLSQLIVLSAASTMAIALAQNLTHAVILLGLAAVPFAGIMVVGYAFFLDLIPQKRTAEFLGLGVVSVAAAQLLGPLIAGTLIDSFGYRAVFPTAGALGLVTCLLLQFIKPPPRIEADAGPSS